MIYPDLLFPIWGVLPQLIADSVKTSLAERGGASLASLRIRDPRKRTKIGLDNITEW